MYFDKVNDKFLVDLGKVLGRTLTQVQRDSVAAILQAVDEFGIEDPNRVAYILGTCWHESRFLPIEEIRARPGTKIAQFQARYWPSGFYGRGFVQLTWRRNYAKFSRILGVDLVGSPELALDVQIAAKVLVQGMAQGLFTGVGLDKYFAPGKTPDWFNARKIVNGTFHADRVAKASIKILSVLLANLEESV